jgi:molybdopterin synthase sulfur carrier subunit
MATVYLPAQFHDLTGGAGPLEIEGHTLRQIVAALEVRFPGLAARISDASDQIAPGLAVSIDGNIASRGLLSPVGAQSEIHFLPAIGGGV